MNVIQGSHTESSPHIILRVVIETNRYIERRLLLSHQPTTSHLSYHHLSAIQARH